MKRVGLSVIAAILFATLLLVVTGSNPIDAFAALISGSFGTTAKVADTAMAWAPLAIGAAGLVVTFSAGLWNIGVEGQIIAGAITATAIARALPGPGWLVILATLIAGFVGGGLWGALAGVLKVRGGVNEIFGGLGLGFLAQALATYLIIGPWQRDGVASTSGTDLFRDDVWLPVVGQTRFSVVPIVIGFLAIGWVAWLLHATRLGLEMRAVGKNLASARLVGIRSELVMLSAFGIGGGMAGLAGALISLGIQHKLVPAVAGGRGFLAILVVMLAGYRARWIGPIALFFAAISIGSSQLNLRLQLDSSLGGVLQGVVVLAALLTAGWQTKRAKEST